MLSLGLCIYTAVFLLIGYAIVRPIVIYIKDPLDIRKYPAPNLLAAIFPVWLLVETMMERRSRSIHAEHKRLGDVIRVSPTHLMFNDPRAIKDIYGMAAISRVAKDEYYDRVAGDFHDLVGVRDRAEHAGRRKALTNAFALKTVVNMEPVIRSHLRNFLQRMDDICHEGSASGENGYGTVNIRLWLNYFTLDLIGDMAFGLPMGFLTKGEDSKEAETLGGQVYRVPGTIHALHRGVRFSVSLAQLGSFQAIRAFRFFVQNIPLLANRLGSVGGADFQNICTYQLRRRVENGPPPRESSDFMDFVLNQKDRKEDPEVQMGKMMADSNMMMNAGSDTTAAALSSTIYHLISNPSCLAKLREEVESCFPFHGKEGKEEGILPYSSVCELPYLRACIDETLRLRPPIAYQLPRLVHSPEGAMIAGHHVRQGTVVAVPPFSIHRHEGLYKDPDAFKPERWLDTTDPEQIQNLKSYTIPFSQGSRACIGRHIAIVELQILISTLVRRYDMTVSHPSQQLSTFERFNSNPGPLPIRIRLRDA